MPPAGWTKSPLHKTPESAAAGGLGNMSAYFKPLPPPKKAGRPPKEPSNAGRPVAAPEPAAVGLQPPTAAVKAAAAKAQSPAANLASAASKASTGEALGAAEVAAVAGAAKTIAKLSKGKETRVNWSLPENRNKMEAAVEGWEAAKKANPSLSIAGYAKSKNVPKETLGKYLNGSRTLGKAQGRPSLLQGDEEVFVTDVTVRFDRGREGLTPAGVINLVRDVKPGLKPKQATNLAEAVRRRNSDRLTNTTSCQSSAHLPTPAPARSSDRPRASCFCLAPCLRGNSPRGLTFKRTAPSSYCALRITITGALCFVFVPCVCAFTEARPRSRSLPVACVACCTGGYLLPPYVSTPSLSSGPADRREAVCEY